MISQRFAYAFSTGLVAAINPCGFAMLPTYLAYFLGLNDDVSRSTALIRAVKAGAAMSAGFVTFFAIVGAIWGSVGSFVASATPWLSIAIGLGLLALGIAMLRGYEPTLSLPKLDMGGEARTVWSMYLYGISYAVASLSCTIPLFVSNLTFSLRTESFLATMSIVAAYGLGMGAVVTALTVATALAKAGMLNTIRTLTPLISKISGALLCIGGLFVVWYAISELRALHSGTSNGLYDWMLASQSRIQEWASANQSAIVVASVALIAVAVGTGITSRRRRAVPESHG